MKTKYRPTGRFFCWILTGILLLAAAVPSLAARTTRVNDTVYRADGQPAAGTLVISWGNSALSRQANNYFGIKAHGRHAVAEMPTTEVIQGDVQTVTARFAAYKDMADCFTCRDQLILHGAVYAETRANAHDPEQFAHALAKHWATDPNYAEKVLNIYHGNNLSRLD